MEGGCVCVGPPIAPTRLAKPPILRVYACVCVLAFRLVFTYLFTLSNEQVGFRSKFHPCLPLFPGDLCHAWQVSCPTCKPEAQQKKAS